MPYDFGGSLEVALLRNAEPSALAPRGPPQLAYRRAPPLEARGNCPRLRVPRRQGIVLAASARHPARAAHMGFVAGDRDHRARLSLLGGLCVSRPSSPPGCGVPVTWQLRATARAQEAAWESSSRAVSVRSALRVWRLRLPRLAVVRSSRQLAAQRRLFAAWALWVASCLQLQRNADTLKAWRGNVSHEVRFNATHRFLWMCIAHRLEWGWARWVTSSAVIRQVGAWHNAIRLAALGRALERWRARATAEMVVDGPGDMRGLLWL